MIIPILFGIESRIKTVIENKQQGSTLAKTLLKSLRSRFPMYMEDQLNLICMFSDPRFKFHILEEPQKKIILQKLETEIFASIKEVPVGRLEVSAIKNITTSATSQLFSIFENSSCQRIQTNKRTLELQGKLQLEAYTNEPRITINDDPFQWWQDNRFKYELISPLAQKYLGIPATEVASERVFSSAGNVITSRRTRLLPENAETLVFLHQNLKSLAV
ncbi:E3 SUMO-protein ligase ZBED1-like [Ischnura elegans]|uniref:E3 SUMO-protein ligase ZBED1-like n=1 Tax=Ischnura elegans TaxID=197161 RepID=UPI001ED86775|nr:E3 SUMO-protein ligase ZBED1-like [Ischnura elegans]